MDRLSPCPAMRDSGVDWLGAVPIHWEVRRVRNLAQMRVSNVDKISQDHESAVRLCNYSDVYYNERINADMPFMRATASNDEIARFRLQVGDVLITKDSEAWNDIGVPAYVESSADDLVSGYHLALLRPDPAQLNGAYLSRALSSSGVASQLHVRANGVTRYGLSHNAILSLWLPVPPVTEQASIVRFLDHADDRIQRYIRAKEKLIALLEEQKQAVIHQAVTGQIDVRTGECYPAYKDSGVEWLGEVPEHWEVRRLKTLCRMKSGEGITSEAIEPAGKYPVYGGNGVRGFASSYTHDGGFVLIGRQGALCGNIHEVRGQFWASEHAVVAAPKPGQVLGWFSALLRAMNLNQYSLAAAQPGLAVERVLDLAVPTPPRGEQALITDYIQAQIARINSARTLTERRLDLVREWRIRLVVDVVTGKLDVRKATSALPEESRAQSIASHHVDDGTANLSEGLK